MELDENQIKALCMMAAGHKMLAISEQTGVPTRTLDGWKAQTHFRKLLRDAMGRMYDAAIAELVLGAKESAIELKRIIHDVDVPTKVKITAINTLLTHTGKAKEAILEQRLEDMESLLDGTDTSKVESA